MYSFLPSFASKQKHISEIIYSFLPSYIFKQKHISWKDKTNSKVLVKVANIVYLKTVAYFINKYYRWLPRYGDHEKCPNKLFTLSNLFKYVRAA